MDANENMNLNKVLIDETDPVSKLINKKLYNLVVDKIYFHKEFDLYQVHYKDGRWENYSTGMLRTKVKKGLK